MLASQGAGVERCLETLGTREARGPLVSSLQETGLEKSNGPEMYGIKSLIQTDGGIQNSACERRRERNLQLGPEIPKRSFRIRPSWKHQRTMRRKTHYIADHSCEEFCGVNSWNVSRLGPRSQSMAPLTRLGGWRDRRVRFGG